LDEAKNLLLNIPRRTVQEEDLSPCQHRETVLRSPLPSREKRREILFPQFRKDRMPKYGGKSLMRRGLKNMIKTPRGLKNPPKEEESEV